ncbi:MAG: DNA-binding response OmpR family regulator [Gammaproteobacteria bacterium]|jgi:DNA-binding response OmpR family regulator
MSDNTQNRSAKSILVVDDQVDNLLLVTRYLAKQGYATRTAASGEEALAKITAEPPDLVLLDVIMPGLDGYEVCRRLKNRPATILIPVILVSTLDTKTDRLKGLKVGADEFLSKPVNAEELMLRVRSLLRLQDAHAAMEKLRIESMQSRLSAHVAQELAQVLLAESTGSGAALQDRESRVGAVIANCGLAQFEETSGRLGGDAERILQLPHRDRLSSRRDYLQHVGG